MIDAKNNPSNSSTITRVTAVAIVALAFSSITTGLKDTALPESENGSLKQDYINQPKLIDEVDSTTQPMEFKRSVYQEITPLIEDINDAINHLAVINTNQNFKILDTKISINLLSLDRILSNEKNLQITKENKSKIANSINAFIVIINEVNTVIQGYETKPKTETEITPEMTKALVEKCNLAIKLLKEKKVAILKNFNI